MGNVFVVFSGYTHHCRIHDWPTKINMHLSLQTLFIPTCKLFSLRIMTSARRKWEVSYSSHCTCVTPVVPRWVYRTPFASKFSEIKPNQGSLNPYNRVVRAMDFYPRNLAQLAMALELAWLNIPVSTFRNLIYSFPPHPTAMNSTEGSFPGFR